MNNREIIENIVTEKAICEYGFGEHEQIPFSDKVVYICQTDCSRYGHCWACPPFVGDIHDCMARTEKYKHFCIFSTVTEVTDSCSLEACMPAKRAHEALTREIRKELQDSGLEDFLVLSTGCSKCEMCAHPDAPCRFPEERLSSMESHGILLVNLLEEMGLSSYYGNDMAVYFSMILFND